MEKKRQRLYGFDFVRVICTLGIFMFHFAVESGSTFYGFYRHANGGWGGIFNSMFFILSGAMIYYNNDDVKNLGRFYLKRWLAIFPAFYLAWLYFYIKNVRALGSLFYMGNRKSLLLTLFAQDGYLGFLGPNYYLVGEWFLGAIVIIYLLYPLLVKIFNKFPLITTAVLCAGWIWVYNTDIFPMLPPQNLITCLFAFELGMLIMRFREKLLNNKWVFFASAFVTLLLLFIQIPLEENMTGLVMGFFATIALYNAGKLIMTGTIKPESSGKVKNNILNKTIIFLSGLSYPFFLLHHQLIVKYMHYWDVTKLGGMIGGMAATMAIILAGAWILNLASKALCKLIKKVIIKS